MSDAGPKGVGEKLSHDHRLQGLSTRRIVREWRAACFRLGADVRFQGRELRPGPLLNAAVLHFCRDLTEPQQDAVARKWLGEMEKTLADEPGPKPRTTEVPGKPKSPKRIPRG